MKSINKWLLIVFFLIISWPFLSYAADTPEIKVGICGEVYKCDVETCGEEGCCKDYDLYEVIYGDISAIYEHLWEMYRRGSFMGECFTRNGAPEGKWIHSLIPSWGGTKSESIESSIWILKDTAVTYENIKSVFIYDAGIIIWMSDRSTLEDAEKVANQLTKKSE